MLTEKEPFNEKYKQTMFVIGHCLEAIYKDKRNRICIETRLIDHNTKLIHRFSFSCLPQFLKQKLPPLTLKSLRNNQLTLIDPAVTIPLPMMSGTVTPIKHNQSTYYEIKDPTIELHTDLR